MAIIPKRENFQVMPTGGVSATVGGAPTKIDASSGYDNLSNALMRTAHVLDKREKIDAAADANKFAEFLDSQMFSLSEKKGVNAFKNEDGSYVRETLDKTVKEELDRMRENMSFTKRDKFDQLIAPYQRNFNRVTNRHISTEYQSFEKATLENTKSQYAKMALMNYTEDPTQAAESLENFRGVARYQALKDGADDALADSLSNNQTSGVVREMINGALMDGNIKAASAWRNRFRSTLSPDDLIATDKAFKRQESIKVGEDFANKAFSIGAISHNAPDMKLLNQITVSRESGGRRYGKNGELLTSPKGAQGEYQVMPKTATDPGYGVTPAKNNSPEELARVGQEYLAALLKKYDGDIGKMWGAYNAGPGTVDNLVKQYGNEWLSNAPKETQGYVTGNVSDYEKAIRTPAKLITPYEFAEKAKATFGDNKQAYQSAVDTYNIRYRVANEHIKEQQKEALYTAFDMADMGRSRTEIEKTGVLDRLDHEHYRKAIDYIEKNTQYDFEKEAYLIAHPDELQSTDLKTLRGVLPRTSINRLARLQAMGRTDQGKNMLEKLNFDMKTVLMNAGIKLNSTKKEEIEVRSQLNDFLTRSLEAFRAENKRYPTDKERLEMIKGAVGDIVVPRMFWFPKTVKRFQATPDDFISSLSDAERNKLLLAANAAGVKGDDEQKILAVLKSKGEF